MPSLVYFPHREHPTKMKNWLFAALCCAGAGLYGQQAPQLDSIQRARETSGPKYFDFNPTHQLSESENRLRLEAIKAQLDTLDISEAKRYRIMRDMYQGKDSKLLAKYLQREFPETVVTATPEK